MAASKSVLLMLMLACFASGGLAVPLGLYAGGPQMLIIAIPGFVIGAFFAVKYATFDRNKKKQEEHRKSRSRNRH